MSVGILLRQNCSDESPSIDNWVLRVQVMRMKLGAQMVRHGMALWVVHDERREVPPSRVHLESRLHGAGELVLQELKGFGAHGFEVAAP